MVAGAVGVCEGGDFNISSLPMLPTGAAHLPFLPTETQRRKKTKISKCSLCVRHIGRFMKIISIPSWKAFEVGIFIANEVRGSMAQCSRPWTQAAGRLWTKSQLLTLLDLRRE